MRRFVPLVVVLGFVAIACGKESSIVPIVSVPPSPTAEVTYQPSTTPTPIPTPTALVTATPTAKPTAVPTAVPTPTPATHTPTTHADTPTNEPPDAYLRGNGLELKGQATSFNWQTSPSKRTTYTDQTPDPTDSINVTKGEVLKISFTRSDSPHDAGARYRTDPSLGAKTTAVPIDKANPATIQANFPSGTVWVDVFTYWPQGDVEHTFKLHVG